VGDTFFAVEQLDLERDRITDVTLANRLIGDGGSNRFALGPGSSATGTGRDRIFL
jgi:hypothetical protein